MPKFQLKDYMLGTVKDMEWNIDASFAVVKEEEDKSKLRLACLRARQITKLHPIVVETLLTTMLHNGEASYYNNPSTLAAAILPSGSSRASR